MIFLNLVEFINLITSVLRYVKLIWFFFALFLVSAHAQEGYHLKAGKDFETINFRFINNLIILPIEVNGVELSFILDTGVSRPILFNLSGEDAPELYNNEEIDLKGLGDGQPVKAIRSTGNTFRMKGLFNTNQELFMITDSNINFSPRLGIPVHGIIGYDLLKNFIVEVKYNRKKIRFHEPEAYRYRQCAKCETYRLDIVGNKPFMNARVAFGEDEEKPVYLLVDSGSTDAIWLFEDQDQGIEVPEKYFDDYMGRGLSGDVYGKRSKLKSFNIGNFEMEDAKVAFPDSISVRHITFRGGRNGSLGSEILKRFNLIIDYPYERITLAKNGNFNAPFRYNMSGIELEHNGFRVVAETSSTDIGNVFKEQSGDPSGGVTFSTERLLSFQLKPALEIVDLRENSPAREVGLQKGDVILSVNGKAAHRYNIQEVKEMLNQRPGKTLHLVVDRNGAQLKFAFKLKEVL